MKFLKNIFKRYSERLSVCLVQTRTEQLDRKRRNLLTSILIEDYFRQKSRLNPVRSRASGQARLAAGQVIITSLEPTF